MRTDQEIRAAKLMLFRMGEDARMPKWWQNALIQQAFALAWVLEEDDDLIEGSVLAEFSKYRKRT